ncbi:MAG TPA: DUF945 family protein [Gammaproteobacteria bacterium]|nr:DUF945 family protein [Gammaproteobacteria bacterium]
MTKRLSLVLATLTLATVCAYFLSGKLIQKGYYEAIAKLNTQPNIKVNLLNYKRGLFHSTADITVEVGKDRADEQVIPLHQVITHGPIIAANTENGPRIKIAAGQVTTTLGDPWGKRFEDYAMVKNPLSIVTLVKFSKQATTWVRVAAIDQTTPTQFHVAWDTVNGFIEHDFNFSYYHGFITLPNIAMNTDDWTFGMKNLTLNLDANKNDAEYNSSNTLTAENVTYSKNSQEVVRLDGITSKLAFFTKDNNLAFDLTATVADSQIVDQHFKNDNIRVQADNINRKTLASMPRVTTMNAKATVDLLQELTVASSNVTLELPKHFTEALISYVSFEIYRTSYLGKFDRRPAQAVLQDITGSINNLVQGAVKQELFLDKGTHYALNFPGAISTDSAGPQG